MKHLFTVLPVLLILCGCAQMTVDVRILDRKYWSSPDQLSNTISDQVADMVRKRKDGEFAAARVTIKTQISKALVELGNNGALDPVDIPFFSANLSESVDQSFAEADRHFSNAFVALQSAEAQPPSDRLRILFAAQSELDAGNASLLGIQQKISAELRTTIQAPRPNGGSPSEKVSARAMGTVKQAESAVAKTVGGLIADRGILDDPLASSVVYAPETYWRRQDAPHGINDTYATGNFGNTDIAIKMESVGNFTIKGVRLDASKITQATFAVGRQAIKTVAAVYGIPLPPSGAPAASGAAPAAFAEVPIGFQSPDLRRAEAEEALMRRRLARVTILETIVIQRKALTSSATTPEAEAARATAIQTVKDVFTANKTELAGATAPAK